MSGAADDLLQLEAVVDRRAAAEAHDDCDDAERNEDRACGEAAPLEELPNQVRLLASYLLLPGSAVMVLISCLQSWWWFRG